MLPWDEYVGIEAAGPAPAGSVRSRRRPRRPGWSIPGVTGQQTVREFVTDAAGRADVPPSSRTVERRSTASTGSSAARRPSSTAALRGLLDAYATGSTRGTPRWRRAGWPPCAPATPAGVHLGGYGWLDDLRPAAGAAVNHGYIHAPSLAQAATAAVLRSGHLAHHDAEHEALEIDLTADRVRTALGLLDGVAQGQPLAALLGYRFERALRDRGA